MVELNRDIIYLILKELQNDRKAFCSYLLVSKSWSEIFIPMLWKNPWKYFEKGNEVFISRVIISHLSDDSRDNLIQHLNFSKGSYQKPLFNYISFCKHLNLIVIERIIISITKEKHEIPIVKSVIINLFINESQKFTHLYIPYRFDYQILQIPGAKCCFTELQFLHCNTSINDDVLAELTEICKSIKELELIEERNINYGIVKLIDISKQLFSVKLIRNYSVLNEFNESYDQILKNSLIKHSNNIQCFKLIRYPSTDIFSSFVNLKILELDCRFETWKNLKNLSLPFLEILRGILPSSSNFTNIIESTSGYLTEIKIDNAIETIVDCNKRLIQAIYQNCPNLRYLKLLVMNNNILEFEKLLINCQYLSGLFLCFNHNELKNIDFNNLFKIFVESSPVSLFKFKFHLNLSLKTESLKLFFDNWKGRYPILLQTFPFNSCNYYLNSMFNNLIEKYTADGLVKHDNLLFFDDFEWIQKNSL
ncbi:hypothetical protein GLOIN_2v1866989 [Rhizophagus clarus]|uniref:F-box domain-containing protein n=1 Tax=Rhizophagus clarus TaxID=94130 RepID=A0A8H3KY51_9GLOM|nr:hypothetical protein GLOIN_2v1866989 [Rhizophagus clarus]